MAQKDLTQKNLEAYPDVFADVLNALYYNGRQVIREEELLPAPTEGFYPGGSTVLKNQFQDVSMYLIRNGQVRMRYMLENQTRPERKMVLRKAGYEGAIYRRQLEEKTIYPVAGTVLYWGKGHWRSPRSLRELFAESFEDHAVKEMEEHVDDVRMDVFEMTGLPADVRKRFRSDMRVIVDYLAEGKDYDPGDRVIRHPEAFLWMLYALTGDARYKKMCKEVVGKENVKMCELLDKYEKRGEKQGLDKVNRLNAMLLQGGRIEDLKRAVADAAFQRKLFQEFGL